jgi:hypothetical protein
MSFLTLNQSFHQLGIMQSRKYSSSYKTVHSYDKVISLHKYLNIK